MVKNHARKNDARTRQIETGETFPVALRNSALSAVEILNGVNRLPVIHLGNSAYFDMNAEKPNLHVTGAFGAGKTWLVNHVVDELIASKANCKIIIIAGKTEQHANAQKAQSEGSVSPEIVLIKASGKDDPSHEESLLEELVSQAKNESTESAADVPVILIVDGINEVSDESTILLQMIAKHGVRRNIHTIITSNDGYGDLPVAIRSSGHSATLGWVGYGQYSRDNNPPTLFSIGAPAESDGTIMIGSHVMKNKLFRSLLIVSDEPSPEATRSEMAMDLAHQVLRKGWGVTVLSDSFNEVNWRMTFGKSIHLATKDAAVILDDLARDRLTMNESTWDDTDTEHWQGQNNDPKRRLLIVDGYFDEVPSSVTENKLDMAAFVNYMRGANSSAHIPVVMTTRETPWFYSLFARAVVVPNGHTTGEVNRTLLTMGAMGVGRLNLGPAEAALAHLSLPSKEAIVFSTDSLFTRRGN
jgi:hypothetical protein